MDRFGWRSRAAAVALVVSAGLVSTAAAAPISERDSQGLALSGPFIPDKAHGLAKFGVIVTGACEPDCELHTSLRVGRFGAARLNTPPRLISKTTIWRDDFNQVRVRPGPAARFSLRQYSGPPLHVTLSVYAEHLGADGAPVRSAISRVSGTVGASR